MIKCLVKERWGCLRTYAQEIFIQHDGPWPSQTDGYFGASVVFGANGTMYFTRKMMNLASWRSHGMRCAPTPQPTQYRLCGHISQRPYLAMFISSSSSRLLLLCMTSSCLSSPYKETNSLGVESISGNGKWIKTIFKLLLLRARSGLLFHNIMPWSRMIF